MRSIILSTFVALAFLQLGGCRSAMYSALEAVGIEKRDLFIKRISDAREAQESAKEQFASALDQFRSVVQVDGGDLERTYDRLNREYERSKSDADAVAARINSVEQVAGDLFREWEDELDQYSNAALRRDSQRLLSDTRQRYAALMKTMRRAESSMQPVLATFQDQVLTLKHNLNAQAVGSLRREMASIERQTADLIKAMERSIAESNEFIASMRQQRGG
jgi:uncharacterized HAD superfamily protein